MRKKEWVVLTKTFRANAAGKRLELDSAIAKILYDKRMAVPDQPKPAVREPEPERPKPKRQRRQRKPGTYNRRDMQAED